VNHLSRKEKEQLYIAKMTELQTRWRNPIPGGDWGLSDLSDEQLEKQLVDTIGQLRFEKVWDGGVAVAKAALILFITLGVIGLLLFGVRQFLGIFR
jgi:hypothetical protein